MEFSHKPVLLKECIDGLNIKPDGTYLDLTLGGGGHSSEILKRLNEKGRLIGYDKDGEAIEYCKKHLEKYSDKITFIRDDFKNSLSYLKDNGIEPDGVLIDLGISSYQIDNAKRGFSYIKDAPLDMRMDQRQSLSAKEVINEYSKEELIKIFYEYGEESFARKIASKIIEIRKIKSIDTTAELASVIDNCIPEQVKRKTGNPCKKVFQAVRIEVNGELKGLEDFIIGIARQMKNKARLCIISFHSLEDRAVKNAFKYLECNCICDKNAPVCVCNKRKEIEIITKKPLLPSEKECKENKRAQSAKLRIAQVIKGE